MTEEDLVAAMSAGDDDAWKHFIAEYGGLILSISARFGLKGPDRDDHLQATCFAVLRSISSLRNPARLSSWLYGIAWRAAVDWKRRRRRDGAFHDSAGMNHPKKPQETEPVGAQELIRREEDVQLYQALLALDPRCRRFLTALYLDPERLSYAELAAREELPVGSIGPIRARCLNRMRNEMQELSKQALRRLPQGSDSGESDH